MPAERHFTAMGSEAHVIVVGGPDQPESETERLADLARRRIAGLEQRWSRFLPDSEVSRLTRDSGARVRVSAETLELVERALDAWRLTGGLFDPTVLGAVIRAGYDRTFEEIAAASASRPSALGFGAGAIEVVGRTVRLPVGCGFDPGGVGKGLAADIVVEELRAGGAAGACVNLGGDVRVEGAAPGGGAWTIAIEHPWCNDPIGRVGIARGATATSTTLKRRWEVGGEARHHLIDPATGAPSASDLTFVSVIAGYAWAAEVFAKAVLLHGTPGEFDLLAGAGAEAIAVDRRGRVTATLGMSAFVADALPTAVVSDRPLAEVSRP